MRDDVITEPTVIDAIVPPQGRHRAVTIPAPITDRQRYFDHYWDTRNLSTVDHRTRLRIGLVHTLLTHRTGNLLDVGCGRGCTAAHFAESGFDVTAIDLSPMAVEWTRRQHPKIRASVVDLELDSVIGHFDLWHA